MKERFTKALVIGGGPAGYTAAIYLGRYGRHPILLSGNQEGGQLTLTTEVENFPGFATPVQGPALMEAMRLQAMHCGAEVIREHAYAVNFSQAPFMISTHETTYFAQTVVIATGAKTKWLGLESESFFLGYGVSSCATCDAPFFKHKNVVVVGGGNTALEDALYLARLARHVTIVHRRDQFRGDKILVQRVQDTPNITVLWNNTVGRVYGNTEPVRKVTGVELKNTITEEIIEHSCDGVFIAIGHTPNSALFRDYLALDSQDYLICESGSTHTTIPGIFVAGDVQDHVYRQAITAAGQGCMAAMDAERFLQTIS